MIPDGAYILAGARDGVDTSLKSCVSPERPCRTEARVALGAMSVTAPNCSDCARRHVFRLFGGRNLASGWRISRVVLVGRGWSWIPEPLPGGGPGLVVSIEAPNGRTSTVRIETLHLIGPANGHWRDAFAGR